jgi:hypothetical protein
MPLLNAIGIVVSDMASSIRFYRLLGLDVPETPDEGHVDTFLPNGVRFMLDTEETVRSFRPEWKRQTGNQLGLAFECESPAQVDEVYAQVTAAASPERRSPGTRSGDSGTPSSRTPTPCPWTSMPRSDRAALEDYRSGFAQARKGDVVHVRPVRPISRGGESYGEQ